MFSAIDPDAKFTAQGDVSRRNGRVGWHLDSKLRTVGKKVGTMERRRYARTILELKTAFRPRKGLRFPTSVHDLTRGGACMEAGFILEEGSNGWLQLPTLSDWEARIIWQRRSLYGLQFVRPFHDAVMTTILARIGTQAVTPIAVGGHPEQAPLVLNQGSRRDQILAGVATPARPPSIAGRRSSASARKRGEDRHYPIGRRAGIHLHGKSSEAAIVNVSSGGLAVTAVICPYIGQSIAVELPSAGKIDGVVTWSREGRFGVRLAAPPLELLAA